MPMFWCVYKGFLCCWPTSRGDPSWRSCGEPLYSLRSDSSGSQGGPVLWSPDRCPWALTPWAPAPSRRRACCYPCCLMSIIKLRIKMTVLQRYVFKTNVFKFAWKNSFDIHLNTIYHSSRYLINMLMYHNFKCVLHVCINRWTIEIIAYFSCLHRSLHHEGYKVSD